MSLNQRIGVQIRKARRLAHMTQKQLGKKLNKSGATIAYLEQGKRRVSPNLLEQIAEHTNRPLSFFYSGGEEQSFDMASQIQRVKDQLKEINEIMLRAEQECKQNMDRIQAMEQKFQVIFEEASDAMILMGSKGQVLEMNKAYESLVGVDKKDFLNKPFWELPIGDEEELEMYRRAFDDTFSQGKSLEQVQHPFATSEGTIEVVSTSRLLMKDGEVWALLSILRPVRDVRQLSDMLAD